MKFRVIKIVKILISLIKSFNIKIFIQFYEFDEYLV